MNTVDVNLYIVQKNVIGSREKVKGVFSMDDCKIMNRLQEHLNAALSEIENDWFVICLQGSQNYGLSDNESDIDSKLLVLPTMEQIVLNKKPINHVHIMDNDEHCDVKDCREYFKIFRKQNINFVEILFTDYWIVNETYADIWLEMRANAEKFAHMNEYAAISCILGMAREKRHALTHKYPSKADIIERLGYDAKQLGHLYRLSFFLKYYINGNSYSDCLYSCLPVKEYAIECKRNGNDRTKEEAEKYADNLLKEIEVIANNTRALKENKIDKELDDKLNHYLQEIVERSIRKELTCQCM